MMKKVVVLIGLVLLSLIYFLYSLNQKNRSNYFLKNPNALAVFVYSEAKSDYIKQKEIPKGYVLNTSKSYCKSGSEIINYDRALGIVNYDLKNDDQCYLYFDIYLPAGYTELTYIEGTGSQWIETNYALNNNLTFEFAAQCTSTTARDGAFLGTRSTANNNGLTIWYNTIQDANNPLITLRYGNDGEGVNFVGKAKGYFSMGNSNNVITYNYTTQDTTIASTYTKATTTYTDTIALLGVKTNGQIDSRMFQGKLYFFKIRDNGTLVRDMVPVKNPSGVVGMYDLVEKKFYANKGSGSFIAGTTKSLLPNGYTQVEYLESTGTQYINTGVIATNKTNVEMDGEFISGQSNSWIPFLGQRITSGSSMYAIWINSSTNAVAVNLASTDTSTIANTNGLGRHTYAIKNSSLYLDGVLKKENINVSSFNSTGPVYLFGLNNGSGSEQRGINARVYSLKFWENGALVRDFIPALNASGTPGLYDLVGKQFYANAGSGTFTYA